MPSSGATLLLETPNIFRMAVAVASRVSEVLRRRLELVFWSVVVVQDAVEPEDEVREVAAERALLSAGISATACSIDPEVILHSME